jgi:NAD(P)-dependent dehydrogenase (short-subunit alcohol dehydrogenase family)
VKELRKEGGLIIGAGSEVGRAIVAGLISEITEVFVAGPDLSKAKSDAKRLGPSASAVRLDVREPDSCREAFARASRDYPLRTIVSCAGTSSYNPFSKFETLRWKQVYEVNLWGAQNVIAAGAEVMAGHGQGGSIVLMSSINSNIPVPGYASYCASKAGLEMLVRVAALELAPQVRVNAVAPGPLDTPGSLAIQLPALRESLAARHLLAKRVGQPSDVVGAVAFLLSDAAAWITGQTLVVDGGISQCFGDTLDFQLLNEKA